MASTFAPRPRYLFLRSYYYLADSSCKLHSSLVPLFVSSTSTLLLMHTRLCASSYPPLSLFLVERSSTKPFGFLSIGSDLDSLGENKSFSKEFLQTTTEDFPHWLRYSEQEIFSRRIRSGATICSLSFILFLLINQTLRLALRLILEAEMKFYVLLTGKETNKKDEKHVLIYNSPATYWLLISKQKLVKCCNSILISLLVVYKEAVKTIDGS